MFHCAQGINIAKQPSGLNGLIKQHIEDCVCVDACVCVCVCGNQLGVLVVSWRDDSALRSLALTFYLCDPDQRSADQTTRVPPPTRRPG